MKEFQLINQEKANAFAESFEEENPDFKSFFGFFFVRLATNLSDKNASPEGDLDMHLFVQPLADVYRDKKSLIKFLEGSGDGIWWHDDELN